MGIFSTLGNILTGTPLLGSLVSAGASLIGGNKQAEAQHEANEQNYKMFKEQLGFTEDMWNKTNAYNNPANQRARYEAAGINPYFALGQITGGNATAQVGSSGNAMIPADASGRAIAEAGATLGNGVAQVVPMFQQVLSNRENIRAQQVENAFRSSRLQNDLVKQVRENDAILAGKNLSDEQRKFYSSQNDELREQILQLQEYNKYIERRARADTERAEQEVDVAYYTARYQEELARYQKQAANILPKYQQAQINNFLAQAAAAVSSSKYFDAQRDTEDLLRDERLRGQINSNMESAARRNGISIDNEQKNALMPLVIQQAANEADAVQVGPVKVKGNSFRRYLQRTTKGTPASKSNYRLDTRMGKPLGK